MKLQLSELERKEEKSYARLEITGKFSELVQKTIKLTYKVPGKSPKDTIDVETVNSIAEVLDEHGLAGPGKGDPKLWFELLGPVEGISEKIEQAKDEVLAKTQKNQIKNIVERTLELADLQKIRGVGEATEEEIKNTFLDTFREHLEEGEQL